MIANNAKSKQNDTFVYHAREGENIPDSVIHVRVHPSIRVIEDWAFNGCSWLTTVILNKGLGGLGCMHLYRAHLWYAL
jgi:hypothetical protein